MKYAHYSTRILMVIMLVVAFPLASAIGQYYYVNSYSERATVQLASVIYKVDINEKTIQDSLVLNIRGEYVTSLPTRIIAAHDSFLITFLINGLPAKNSQMRGPVTTFYTVVNLSNFRTLREDSLPYIFIYDNMKAIRDSLYMDWLDESPTSHGYYRGSFSVSSNDSRLRMDNRMRHREEFDDEDIIGNPLRLGEFGSPTLLFEKDQFRYFWGYRDGLEAVLFKTDRDNNILAQETVGNKNISSVLIGYNPIDSLIYVFKLRYYLETQAPPIASPDSVSNVLLRIRPSDFSVEGSLALGEEPYIIANEMGSMEFIDSSFVYYYALGEGYGSFQPASVFIFDTRTNEATWLRVGWR